MCRPRLLATPMKRCRLAVIGLATTPIRRSDFLLSLMLARLVCLAAELGLVLGFAWLAFRVPVRGSLLNNAMRAIMLEGAGLAGIAAPIAIVAAWGIASFALAVAVFRWR